jgi:hypothetical protein
MRNILQLLLIASLLTGCEPAATFEKPQPEATKTLSVFPKKLRAHYLGADKISILTITDKAFIRTFDFYEKISKDSLEKDYQLKGDILVDRKTWEKEQVEVNRDAIIRHYAWVDTVFRFSPDQVARKYKGYFFLNSRYGEKRWEVRKVGLKNGKLTIGYIEDKQDIERLKEITQTKTDTFNRRFNLNKKQFKKFVKAEGFGKEEVFTRIKVERM